MNSIECDKIFKSWSGINELALIKEVATKGEHIDLCIQYWSHKRKIPIDEYEIFFKEVVHKYVERLLSEKLVCKAESVLLNTRRNVNCVFFQFAKECNDADLNDFVLHHLHQKDPYEYDDLVKNLNFQWDLLQHLKSNEKIYDTIREQIKDLSLESFAVLDFVTQQRIMIELHFAGKSNSAIFNKITEKYVLWDYLVEVQNIYEIIRWCAVQENVLEVTPSKMNDDFIDKYAQWFLEPKMFEKATKALNTTKDDVLRNCFTAAGYILPDELNNIQIGLRRLCITNSYTQNERYLSQLNLGNIIWQKKLYYLLLQDIVSLNEIEVLTRASAHSNDLMNVILCLKKYTLEHMNGFEEVSKNIQLFLEKSNTNVHNRFKFVTLFNLITYTTTSRDVPNSTILPLFSCGKNHLQIEESGSNPNREEAELPKPCILLESFRDLNLTSLHKRINILEIFEHADKHQQTETQDLNYLHYIKQSRSAYAVHSFITNHLQHYGQVTKAQLWVASEGIYYLTLALISDDETAVHCVAFCEMLGFDTQQLRCLLKLIHYMDNYHIEAAVTTDSLIKHAERKIIKSVTGNNNNVNKFPLDNFKAIMTMKLTLPRHNTAEGTEILQHYARANNFWCVLVLLQYFEIPLDQIKILSKHFSSKVTGNHLFRALSTERRNFRKNQLRSKRRKVGTQVTCATSAETITSSGIFYNEPSNGAIPPNTTAHQCLISECISANMPDLFALILLNTNNAALGERFIDIEKFLECIHAESNAYGRSNLINFLQCAIEYHMPVLSVLGISFDPLHAVHIKWCWLVWLSVTTQQWHNILDLAVANSHDFPWNLVELLIRRSQLKPLLRSFYIFYPENPIAHLFRFLDLTTQRCFDDGVIHELRLYGLALSNDEIKMPFSPLLKRKKLMTRCIRFLLLHLQHNFNSAVDQQEFLACICKSGLSDITGLLDFCLLKDFHRILYFIEVKNQLRFTFNFVNLMEKNATAQKYEEVLRQVLEAKEYNVAVRLAELLQKPVGDIIYNKWTNGLERQLGTVAWDAFHLALDQYEEDIIKYSLPPETLVNFLLHATSCLPTDAHRVRYLVLQKALNVIKYHHLFPNESFDRDQIEHDMIWSYLSLVDEDLSLPLYNSEYYEQIMRPERCVLYKSFWELKELAGIDDLNIARKCSISEEHHKRLEHLILRLLDEGDIVEALRLQELFKVRPLDLRLVVFCMALAEGLSTVSNMSPDERQLFSALEKVSFSKFNKRTLGGTTGSHLLESTSALEYDEMPCKEKQQTLSILQGIASKLTFGLILSKRIICVFRAAMYLEKEYVDILRTKDIQVLLQSVAKNDCLQRLLVVSDILTSTQMESREVAELLAYEITTAVVRPCFYIFNNEHPTKSAELWGYDVDRDLHLFLELTPDRIKLGASLLEYCDALNVYRQYRDNNSFVGNVYFKRLVSIISQYGLPANRRLQPSTVSNILYVQSPALAPLLEQVHPAQVLSHKKQNIICIELLIKAHQCFVHECSMEGIANVLKRAKTLNSVLTKAKSWRLIVRLLTGIGRYREMHYCFDALIANEQFESLLGQFDEDKTVGLRQAILAYLREHSPPEHAKELFKLCALHFLMYKELAEFWQQDAQALLTKTYNSSRIQNDNAKEVTQLCVNADIVMFLNRCLEYFIHATENYILDNKLLAAQNSAVQAELVALQIDLARKALEASSSSEVCTCVCLICLKSREHFKYLINHKLSVSQSIILSRAYDYDINWSEALLQQFVIKLKSSYLKEFLLQVDISDDIIENVSKSFQVYSQQQHTTQQMEQHLMQLNDLVQSITLKYKLASMVITGKSTVLTLINDTTIHYLRDLNFGRHDENRPL